MIIKMSHSRKIYVLRRLFGLAWLGLARTFVLLCCLYLTLALNSWQRSTRKTKTTLESHTQHIHNRKITLANEKLLSINYSKEVYRAKRKESTERIKKYKLFPSYCFGKNALLISVFLLQFPPSLNIRLRIILFRFTYSLFAFSLVAPLIRSIN